VPLVTSDDVDADTAELLTALGDLNIFRALAHHPKLLKRWLVFGAHVLNKSTLSPRHRELVILRVGWRCQSEYEFGQHTVIGRGVGISDDEIRLITQPDTSADTHWDAADRLVLSATDELLADYEISQPTWDEAAQILSTEQLMDLVFAVGQYSITCMALKTLHVPLDEGVPGFPE